MFRFYEVGSDTFPWFTNRLSKYNYPLDVSFYMINESVSTKSFIDQISQLTQLKSVQIHGGKLKQDVESEYWYKLSSLHSIQGWIVDEPWPLDLLKEFPNLKQIRTPNPTPFHNASKIEQLIADISDTSDVIESLPNSLHSLTLNFIDETFEDHDLNYLTNLTDLDLSGSFRYSGEIDVRDITSLRSLKFTNLNVDGFSNCTNLTELLINRDVYDFENIIDAIGEMRSLERLEKLTLSEPVHCNRGTNPFAIYSRLTFLDANVSGDLSLLPDTIRHLVITIHGQFEIESLAHLTELKHLEICSLPQTSAKASKYGNLLNQLTQLKYLKVAADRLRLPSISKLTDLEQLTLTGVTLNADDYYHLTNLKRLKISYAELPEESWNNFSHLKKLTYLENYYLFSGAETILDYNAIANLPLRTLICRPHIKELNLFESLAKMTDLRYLELLEIAHADQFTMLTHLQHLRQMLVTNNVEEVRIRHLRAIQMN
jgi:hypothetical protein